MLLARVHFQSLVMPDYRMTNGKKWRMIIARIRNLAANVVQQGINYKN